MASISIDNNRMQQIQQLIIDDNLPAGRKESAIHTLKVGIKVQKATAQMRFMKTLMKKNLTTPEIESIAYRITQKRRGKTQQFHIRRIMRTRIHLKKLEVKKINSQWRSLTKEIESQLSEASLEKFKKLMLEVMQEAWQAETKDKARKVEEKENSRTE